MDLSFSDRFYLENEMMNYGSVGIPCRVHLRSINMKFYEVVTRHTDIDIICFAVAWISLNEGGARCGV
jgi:hypothetical protein